MASIENLKCTLIYRATRSLVREGFDPFLMKSKRYFKSQLPYRAARILAREGPVSFLKKSKVYYKSKLKERSGRYSSPSIAHTRGGHILPPDLPKVSIISILYNKSDEVTWFLQAIFDQRYLGEIEVVFVDDQSTDGSVQRVNQYWQNHVPKGKGWERFSLRILVNSTNRGNCYSRNFGIRAASGEIQIIIDADCVVNREYINSIAEAYYLGGCDATVGPMNIESLKKNPLKLRNYLETRPLEVARRMALQDEVNFNSFVNCVTRNFSIRKGFFEGENLFDESFSYSSDPESGFGWEDIEMGFRLYQKGARIKFLHDTFAVHVTHPVSLSEETKSQKSLRNFTKLIQKHPDIINVSREWSLETHRRIVKWTKAVKNQDIRSRIQSDLTYLEPLFAPKKIFRHRPFEHKKYKILSYRWHVPHQYELYKTGHEFSLLTGIVDNFTQHWSFDQRPMPQNAKFKDISKVNFKDFDLAILHFDENVLDWQNTNGVLDASWGAMFSFFMDSVNLPKVAICHGTPQFYGQYNNENCSPELKYQVIEESRQRLVERIGHMPVICNSHQAEREWRFKNSRVIWQGFEPTEFPKATYEKGIVSLGRAMKERAHYRGFDVYQKVFDQLPKCYAPAMSDIDEPSLISRDCNKYAVIRFRNYVDQLRSHSIYFNPTIRSPMPRSRGEAMMCGLATVSLDNHDINMFIKNGINGFYSSDHGELAEYLRFLSENSLACRKIGERGRQTAMNVFNIDRYLGRWQDVIQGII